MMLPEQLYTAERIREFDRQAIAGGVAGFELMRRAAQVSLNAILARWPDTGRVFVFAGSGNNGGDGVLLAALAREQGLGATVFQCGIPDASREDANKALRLAQARTVKCHEFDAELAKELLAQAPPAGTVIVDALLGTGGRGEPRPDIRLAVDCINHAGLPVVALDIPTGLDADTGHAPDVTATVHADLTATFIGLKQGLFTGVGPAVCGEIVFHALDVSPGQEDTDVLRRDIRSVAPLFARRRADAHKGSFGNVLVIGGDSGFGGAALMAAEAAARTGAGTVTLLTRAEHVTAALARRPEIMVRGVEQPEQDEVLQPLFQRASVIVIGPGLGSSSWSRLLLQQALRHGSTHCPLVMDADALNLLAADEAEATGLRRAHWVLTPHPGEAARLLGIATAEIQADRFAAARKLQSRYGGCCILKGAGSLSVYEQDGRQRTDLCNVGNPGMATGGMGDVLSGIIGGLLAQFLSSRAGMGEICTTAVCVHGASADLAAQANGQRGLLATDLLSRIQEVINR